MKQETILIKILAGEGGQDSWLFALDLAEVYIKFAKSKGYSVNINKTNKDIKLDIYGEKCYDAFQKESGIHRVQRIPPTETKGRIHTSIINVIILNGATTEPSVLQNDLLSHHDAINKKNIKISYYKDSGSGGQHRNKTMSGVRLQYQDEIIECCEGRSQRRNKELAFQRLEKKLLEKQKQELKLKTLESEHKQNKNKGKRGNFYRNYNFQRNEIIQDGEKYPLREFMKGKINIIK